jgi:hypothetical protein
MSLTITPELRKKIRLASALHDMEEGEWCRIVLATAAKKIVERFNNGEVTQV